MADLTSSQKEDYERFYVAEGDPDFSPARNKAIIEGTIKKYEAYRRKKDKEYVDSIRERADAVATYLKHVDQKSDTPVEKYFSKSELAYLRGQQIVERLQGTQRILMDVANAKK
jgi:hypothetical protein